MKCAIKAKPNNVQTPVSAMRRAASWLALALALICIQPAIAQAPRLSVRSLPDLSVQLAWPSAAADFVLEQAESLTPPVAWQTVPGAPAVEGTDFTVTVAGGSSARFYRLRQIQPAPLTTITSSSPADGETGVAVTRETIIHFSAPLAPDTVLKTNHFYATFGARRILSRIELSSDRAKAALFYLEPLPGGARVNVFFDSEGLKDAQGRPLDPSGSGRAGGFEVIQFETLSLTPVPGTAVTGRVFASELAPASIQGAAPVNRPLAGVTITVDGLEQSVRAVTDAQGNFTLNNCPAGRFFVHIDGRTVRDDASGIRYPDRSYYPFVGKAWDAMAGRTDNKAGGTGEIFLPLIAAGALQTVSAAEDTRVSFPAEVVRKNPELAGVSITVPANALFSDNGTRGGKVGIAPVAPDRLPGPLPAGLEMPLVITVQTDGGLNFDRPAPICFPNLPDPVLKTPLPAGSKQTLISFNHDKGLWEGVGSMTVSADGKMICTDPGEGILQPGWHGVGPVSDGPPLPPCGGGGDGGGGPSLASAVSHAPGAALSTLALPPFEPASGERDPECLSGCESDFDICIQGARVKLAKKTLECFNTNQIPAVQFACVKAATDVYDLEKNLCKARRIECRQSCPPKPPPPPPPPPSGAACKVRRKPKPKPKPKAVLLEHHETVSRASLDRAATVAQIGLLLDEAAALAQASGPSGGWSQETGLQVATLLESAHALAGGDAGNYILDYLREMEAQADLNDEINEPDGNAPPYAVIYAAEVLRPDGLFYLRGETAAHGQYALFVPRDGTLLSVRFYDPKTKTYDVVFPWLRPNVEDRLPSFTLFPIDAASGDLDRDGLPDAVELVYGTDRTLADSDGDGLSDGAEVENGTDPLDGRPMRIGVIAAADTPGIAYDVCMANNLAIVADGAAGVSIFDISDAFNPVLIRQLNTTGAAGARASALACDGRWAAAANGGAGLMLIDLGNPAGASIHLEIPFETPPVTVAVANGVAYAGFANGNLQALDIASGALLAKVAVGSPVADLAVAGDQLYLVTGDINATGESPARLLIYDLIRNEFNQRGSMQVPNTVTPLEGGRLFVGGGLAYLSGFRGYSVIDVSDPGNPRLIGKPPATQPVAHDLAANGSGLLLVTTSFAEETTLQVSLYDAETPADVTKFLTAIETPGFSRTLAIHNGLAFVADDHAGLQVVNYLPYDNKGVPPVISLSASFSLSDASAEELAFARLTANASDDVQVRNVEFYLDGALAAIDGGFPFEFRFQAPRMSAAKNSLTLRAKATDTGGNSTWSNEVVVRLTPDITPPVIRSVSPRGVASGVNTVAAAFSEALDPAIASAAAIQVFAAGEDGKPGTSDDRLMTGGSVSLSADQTAVTLSFPSPLPLGFYRVIVKGSASDVRGNPIGADLASDFQVIPLHWIKPGGGEWNDPANWSTGKLPGPEDSVFIDVPDKEAVIVLRGARGALRPFRVRSLASNEEIALLYANLHVKEPMQLNNILTISGSKVTDTVLRGGPKAVLAWRSFDGGNPETPEGYPGALVRATLEGDFQSWEAFNVVERLTLNNANVYGIRLENGLPEPKPTGAGAGWLFWEGAIVDGAGTFNNFRINSWSQPGFPGGFTVTLGPGVTMRGHTEIIFNPTGGALINQGTISAGYLEPAPPSRPDIPLPVLSQITIGGANCTFINEGTVEFRNYARAQLQSFQGSPAPLPALQGSHIVNRGVLRVTENAALSILGDLVSEKTICDPGAVCRIEAAARWVTPPGQVSEFSGAGHWFVLGEFLGGTVRAMQGAILEGSPIFSDVTLEGELRNFHTAAGGALTPRLLQLPPHARGYAAYGIYVEVKTNLTLNGLIRFHRAPEEFGGGLLFSRLLGSRNDRLGGNGRVVFDRASSPHGMGGITGNITIEEGITIEGRSLYLGPAMTHNRGTILSDQAGDSLEFIGGITNSGTIRLGASLLVTNRAQFAQTPAGKLVILASGTQPGATHAQIKNGFFGSMSLDGNLVLETLDPFQPRAGDVFELLQHSVTPAVPIPRAGMFESHAAPPPPLGQEWIPEYGPGSFRLRLGAGQ